jgi:hypothetical protein
MNSDTVIGDAAVKVDATVKVDALDAASPTVFP